MKHTSTDFVGSCFSWLSHCLQFMIMLLNFSLIFSGRTFSFVFRKVFPVTDYLKFFIFFLIVDVFCILQFIYLFFFIRLIMLIIVSSLTNMFRVEDWRLNVFKYFFYLTLSVSTVHINYSYPVCAWTRMS